MYLKLTNLLGLPPWMRFVLEVFALALLFGFLVFLNWALGLEKDLRGPTALRPIWLGMLGVLAYLAIRLFLFILAQLPGARAEFPDIKATMDELIVSLADAGISFRDTAVFLCVGMLPEEEAGFEQSSLIGRKIRINSRRYPLHCYGDEQGLWITLPGISALVQQREAPPTSSVAASPESLRQGNDELDLASFEGLDENEAQFATIGAAGVAGLSAAIRKVTSAAQRQLPGRLSAQDRELSKRRLEYFLRLLRDARKTVCSYNAVLVTLPYHWLTSSESPRLAEAANNDLSVLQKTGGVKCLSLTVFTGIEDSSEFSGYVKRLDRSELERRCGCGYPPLTTYAADDGARLHHWLVEYFERQSYELYQRNLDDPENRVLFRFLNSFRSLKSNFSRLLQQTNPSEGEPLYFGGVYFASLGRVGSAVRPFWDGAIAKLRREHDDVVGWNDQAVAADRRYHKSMLLVMGLIAALTVVDAVLIVLILL